MILIDMRMPGRCMDCPGSYWIQTGPDEGKLMCNIMEYMGMKDPLVEEQRTGRPEECPMMKVDLAGGRISETEGKA